jgi:hypothetical protein
MLTCLAYIEPVKNALQCCAERRCSPTWSRFTGSPDSGTRRILGLTIQTFGIIVGSAALAVLLVAGSIIVICCCCKRRRQVEQRF